MMGKRGPKPKGKVKIKWSSDFAYAIGLIASDGCLSGNRRHISLTTIEIQQAENFKKCLGLDVMTGNLKNGDGRPALRVQFGDVLFYNFLLSIGLTPAKSKTIAEVKVPDKYFFDFLRGVFDGDGSTYSYWDKRWKSSFMFYLGFASASLPFLEWMQSVIFRKLGVTGHYTHAKKSSIYQLKFAKGESLIVFREMYKNKAATCLTRKRLKIDQMLSIVGVRL